ncbi:MarR family winged helix-turn-helix transcriptional regulator [Belnapia mucosa]|nr:MarR family transcriptional regulator [Belnapia mucosa]
MGITIAQIARRWRGRLDARIAEFGLTEARWLALLTLARHGEGMTQKDLAHRLLIEGPTLVRTLDWLEGEGLVERRSSTEDRRAKTLHLTPEARPLIQRIEAAATLVRAEIMGGIPEEELAACLAVLERVAQSLANPSGAAATPP